ncbi:hypothetical protein [Actinoplanes subtropicus]|uniref:hypothetical protein n=1 Tax=Actinoplanes subtropicus TaxID=543632 RepID=UPI0004C3EB64|nr:hypothetical protein [Actinoplanes subtropicus]
MAVVAVLLAAFAVLLVVVAQHGQDARRGSGNGIQVMGTPHPAVAEHHGGTAVLALKPHEGDERARA